MYVYKLMDEWYCVSFYSADFAVRDYKCDQLDGLLSCLKKFGIE